MGVRRYPAFPMPARVSILLVESELWRRTAPTKLVHVDPAIRNPILWERVKLNLSPTVIFSKHIFWVMRKTSDQAETMEMLRNLTRDKE